jgi:motility quorum-sensing regulator/GCU-specific mRNA interferase toxin
VDEKRVPHYDLDEIKQLVAGGDYSLTTRVARHVRSKGWGSDFPVRCIGMLEIRDLHKSQRHLVDPSRWLDIYRPRIEGVRMYVKFTVEADGDVLVLSLCLDREAH